MRTGNALILVTAMVLIVFIGIVVAEDFMMPQELEEKQTVSNNSSNGTNHSVDVKRHVPPRGVMQKVLLVVWDPFGHAPIEGGFKVYNGALWYPYPDGTWIQVAFINNNKQVTHIQVWNQNIVNEIKNNYQTADNVTVTLVEEPTTYDIKQSDNINGNNSNNITDSNDSTASNNAAGAEKINTSINLNDRKLSNDTNTTITGTLVDENGTAIANAEVTITVNGQSYTQMTDSNGQFSYEYNTESSDLSIGSNSMQVSYSGDETYNGASKTVTLTLEAVEAVDDTVESSGTQHYTHSSSSHSSQKRDNSMNSYSSEDEEYTTAVDNSS